MLFQRKTKSVTVTIAEDDIVSNTINFAAYSNAIAFIPTTFVGTDMDILVSADGITWAVLTDDAGDAVSFTVTADEPMSLPLSGHAITQFKVQFQTTGTPDTQTADVSFKMHLKS